MKIKAIVFDKDGTIVDFEKLWIPVTRAAAYSSAKIYGLGRERTEAYIRRMGIIDDHTVDIRGTIPRGDHREIVGFFEEELGSIGVYPEKDELYRNVLMAYGNEAKEKYGSIEPICEGIRGVISCIKDRGIIIALITADDKSGAEICLKRLGIYDLFDHVIGFDGVNPSKPDPYRMNEFMSSFGLCADEVLMVGDTETDILFAKNSKTLSIGVGKTEQNREYLKACGADAVFHDISAIPGWIDKRENG